MFTSSLKRRQFLHYLSGATLGTSLSLTHINRAFPEELEASNETIKLAREQALAVLQPTDRDLQHGLALHRDAVIFDAYGFAPRAAINGDQLKEAVLAGASQQEIQDLREEMMMTRYVTNAFEKREFLQAWKASGVTCIFQNAGEEGQSPLRLLKRLARFTYATDMMPNLEKAVHPNQVIKAKQQGISCLYFSGNGVPLTQQWISVEDELRYLRVFFQLGIRMMHLTYQRRNMIGDGCAEPANGGLSDFGRSVISEMNRVGVIVDVAHCGWQTSLEAAQLSQKPMVASHTACTALRHHIRNKPDNIMRAIADTGGYAGICCIPSFLGGQGDLTALLDHIDYLVKHFGADHVAIGTDVAYQSQNARLENRKVPPRGRARTPWRSLWPEGSLRYPSKAPQSLAWINWPLFTVGLVQRGHSDDTIRKIIGTNVLRVAQEAIPAHKSL